jgi:hypothetical protein
LKIKKLYFDRKKFSKKPKKVSFYGNNVIIFAAEILLELKSDIFSMKNVEIKNNQINST